MRRHILLALLLTACGSQNNSRIQANELAAFVAIRAINAEQTHFFTTNSRYASQLSELGNIIPASGISRNYEFQLTGDGKTYQIAAVPQTYGATGRQSFYTDQTLIIRATDGPQPASAASPEIR